MVIGLCPLADINNCPEAASLVTDCDCLGRYGRA
jgi:hypothetical protein